MAKISSQLEICNLALLTIGQHSISSLDKNRDDLEESLQAETCNAFYDQARMSLLSRYSWSFALNIARYEDNSDEYTTSVKKSLWNYTYEYQLPEDFLKLVAVRDDMHNNLSPIAGQKPPYAIYRNTLFSDVFPCKLVYVMDEENITAFSPLFIDCLVYDLAIRLTKIFNDSTTFLQMLQMNFDKKIAEAKSSDCRQIILDTIHNPPIISTHLGAI